MERIPSNFSKEMGNTPTDSLREEQKLAWKKKRDLVMMSAIKEGCTSKGLRMKNVQEFFVKRGLKTTDIILPNRDQFDRLEIIFRKTEGTLRNLGTERKGFTLPNIRLVVVIRDEKEEAINGSVFTESIAVHELAHSTGYKHLSRSWDCFVSADNSETTTIGKRGFRSISLGEQGEYISRGAFFEEAFAEMCRAEFLTSECNTADVRRMTGEDNPERMRNTSFGLIPSKYFYKRGDENLVFGLPAIAAASMEKILNNNGRLDALASIRSDDIGENDKLRNLVSSLCGEEVFNILYNLQYTKSDFFKGKTIIENAMNLVGKREK